MAGLSLRNDEVFLDCYFPYKEEPYNAIRMSPK